MYILVKAKKHLRFPQNLVFAPDKEISVPEKKNGVGAGSSIKAVMVGRTTKKQNLLFWGHGGETVNIFKTSL